MKCPEYEDECPDPEACMQSYPCKVVRHHDALRREQITAAIPTTEPK
jgi:hypothetical protein